MAKRSLTSSGSSSAAQVKMHNLKRAVTFILLGHWLLVAHPALWSSQSQDQHSCSCWNSSGCSEAPPSILSPCIKQTRHFFQIHHGEQPPSHTKLNGKLSLAAVHWSLQGCGWIFFHPLVLPWGIRRETDASWLHPAIAITVCRDGEETHPVNP